MYINLGNTYKITTHNIGAYFTNSFVVGLSGWANLPYTPQIINPIGNLPDTLNWTLVSGDYTALRGEKYIIIGNFDNDLNTDTITFNPAGVYTAAYVYIDDVSLTPCSTNSIHEQSTPTITLYPNPVTDKLTIESLPAGHAGTKYQVQSIKLYNVLGECVLACLSLSKDNQQ